MAFLWLLIAWLMIASSVAAADERVAIAEQNAVAEGDVWVGADPGDASPRVALPVQTPADDPVDPVLPAPEVSPIVVDDPVPVLPVWDGNPETDRPGLVLGVSEVVVDPGEKRAAPVSSPLSFEVGEKDAFPDSVRFEVETFKPELVESVSPFGAGFRIEASVPLGEVKWDSPVEAVLDYADLPIVHGAGAGSRLQMLLLEGCEVSVQKAGDRVLCKSSTPLESVSNPTARVVRATLPVDVLGRVLDAPSRIEMFDLSGGGFSMLTLTSGSSGSGGDFAAAPFQTVSSWDVGEFSGAAETSYPIDLPTAAVGPTPSVMLSYSSAAIDGMHEFSNNQVGSIGAGWSYSPGYITRHLKPCESTGHLCSAGTEYSIVLNGVSSRLIWLGGASFKVQDDPYWKVTRKTHPDHETDPDAHPDALGKYWEVVAKDGTTYIFGYTEDSAQTIPLNGGADHVYQWDLNEIRDTDGNSAFLTYAQEFNRYGSGDEYVQSSHLELIEYSILDSQPSLRVEFNHEVRCGDALTTFGDCVWPDAFVDTPTDLWCPSGTCSVASPTFWTALRLGSIQVQTLRNTSGDRWSTLALYDLAQFAPVPDHDQHEGGDLDASERRTLLYRIHQRPEGEYTYNAYQQIEAEGYTYHGGNIAVAPSDDVGGGDVVSWSSATHLSFHETHFEDDGAAEIVIRAASEHTGQQIKVYDSYPFTTPLATIDVPHDGFDDYGTVSVAVAGLSGIESVYLALSGTQEARLNWVRFKPTSNQESLPPVHFDDDWQWLGNRKNHGQEFGVLSPMAVARIGTIRNEYGGKVSFNYLNDGANCIEWGDIPGWEWTENVQHCFPVDVGGGTWITFLKWVVDDVTVYDPVMGTTQVYEYTYGTPRWVKSISPTADCEDTSWNVFRGHSWVEVEDPFGLTTTTWFYQGMKDDPVDCNGHVRTDTDEINISVFGTESRPDEYWLVGRPAGSITEDTGGTEFSRTDTEYIWTENGGSGPRDAARFIGVDQVDTTITDGGTAKTTRVSYLYDGYGNITQEYRHGDLADSTDKRFTSITYVYQTTSGYIVDRPSETKLFDVTPGGDVRIGRTLFFWDSSSHGTAPTEGHLFYERHYASNGSSDWVQTRYTYKPDGRLATVRDPNLHTTTYTYDDSGVPYGRLVSVADAEGLVTETGYDAYFRVDSVTDPRNLTTTAARDDYGRVTAVSTPGVTTVVTLPGNGRNVVEYSYTDSTPARLQTKSHVDGSMVVGYTYADGFGRAFQTQTVSPANGHRVVTTSATNNAGVLKYQSEPFETTGTAGAGAITPTWTSLPLWHRYQFNTQGERTKDETMILGTLQWDVVTAAQGWWKTTVTDPNNTDKVYYSDPFGNTVQIDERIDAAWKTTTYDYDKANRLLTVTDAASTPNVTLIVYDWLGRKDSIDDPDMGEWSYGYDAVGNLISQTDGSGDTVQWEYDDINRPTRRHIPNQSTPAEWHYYPATDGHYAGLLDWSEAFNSSFGTIEQHYDNYDNGGRVTDQRTIVPGADGGSTFRMQWSYDFAGNLLSLTYPDGASGVLGETVTYDYDSLGHLVGLDGDDTYVADATYEYWGAIDTMTLGSGTNVVDRDFEYWNNRRLSIIQAGVSGSATNIANLHITRYDNNGNIETLTDWTSDSPNSGQRQCFEYDQANRLTEAFTATDLYCGSVDTSIGVAGYNHSFTYDAVGNLKTRTDVAFGGTYNYGAGNAGPHAVTSIGANYAFSYDGNGNMTSRTTPSGTQALDWTDDNRLSSVADDGTTTSFGYDAEGNRVLKIVDDGTDQTATVYIGGVYERNVGAAELLIATPSSLSLTGVERGVTVEAPVEVTASAGSPVFSAFDDRNWLVVEASGVTADPPTGTVEETITIKANPDIAGVGTHTGTVTLAAAGYVDASIDVTFTVDPADISQVQTVDGSVIGGTSVSATFPMAPTPGNHLIAVVGSGAGSINTPAGWNVAGTDFQGAAQGIYWKNASVSDSTVTFTFNESEQHSLVVFEYSGLADPPDDQFGAANDTSGSKHYISVSADGPNSQDVELNIVGAMSWHQDIDITWGGYTEAVDAHHSGPNGSDMSYGAATKVTETVETAATTVVMGGDGGDDMELFAVIATFKADTGDPSPIVLEHSDTGSGSAAQFTAALPSSPVAGDLLVIGVAGGRQVSIDQSETGWVEAQRNDDGTTQLWYRVADGTDSDNDVVFELLDGADQYAWVFSEYSATSGWGPAPLGVKASEPTSGWIDGSEVSSGTTDTPSGDGLGVAMLKIQAGDTEPVIDLSFTNNYTLVDTDGTESGTAYSLQGIMAANTATTMVPQETTATWGGEVHNQRTGVIGVFLPADVQLPALTVDPLSLELSGVVGGNSATGNVALSVTEGTGVAFTTDTGTAGWLSVAPASGTVSAGTPVGLTITGNPTTAGPGVHEGTVTISANGHQDATIDVTFTVDPDAGSLVLLEQSNTGASSASTFTAQGSTAPVVGSLLVVGVTGGGDVSPTTSGWTKAVDADGSDQLAIWYKIATGSDDSIGFQMGSTNQYAWVFAEYSTVDGWGTDPLDVTAYEPLSDWVYDNQVSSGTTGVPPADGGIAVAMFTLRGGQSVLPDLAFTSGYSMVDSDGTELGQAWSIEGIMAATHLSDAAAQSTIAEWDDGDPEDDSDQRYDRAGVIAVFLPSTETPTPQLQASPASLSLDGVEGGTVDEAIVGVSASDSQAVPFTVSDDADWLTLTPAAGTTSTDVAVSADPVVAGVGVHTATVTIVEDTTGDPTYTGATVDVTFEVTPVGGASISQVQKKATVTDFDGTSVSVTLDDPPTPGNTLIVVATSGADEVTAGPAGFGAPDRLAVDQGYYNLRAVWSKTVQAGDSATVTVTFDMDEEHGLAVFEYAGLAADPYDVGADAWSEWVDVSSQTSGTTPVTSQADELVIGFFSVWGPDSTPTWTPTGYTTEVDLFDGAIGNLFVTSQIVDQVGSQQVTVSGFTDDWVQGMIVTYKADPGGTAAATTAAGGDEMINAVSGIYTSNGNDAIEVSLAIAPPSPLQTSAALMYQTSGDIATTETWYYQFGGQQVAMRQAIDDQDQGVQFLVSDHLGSTAVSYDPAAGDISRQYYYPWGNLRGSSDPTVDTDIGYTGQHLDTSTDLMYYNARYYDPTIGRFISPDTIVPDPTNPQDLNRYSYVRNNPIRYSDPTGHCVFAGQQIYAGPCRQDGGDLYGRDYGYDYDWGNPDTNGCVGCGKMNDYLKATIGGDPLINAVAVVGKTAWTYRYQIGAVVVSVTCVAATAGSGSWGCYVAGATFFTLKTGDDVIHAESAGDRAKAVLGNAAMTLVLMIPGVTGDLAAGASWTGRLVGATPGQLAASAQFFAEMSLWQRLLLGIIMEIPGFTANVVSSGSDRAEDSGAPSTHGALGGGGGGRNLLL